MKISQLGEFGLIDAIKIYAPVSKNVIKGIGDDAAVLPYTKTKYLLLATDMMAQGVHFTMKMRPESIGHKALACNISDIAAMGGLPTYAVVSLGIPRYLPVKWVKNLYKGMSVIAKDFGVNIVGGDTIKADRIVINLALMGQVEKKYLISRDGAKPKDWIFVTGPLGGSLRTGRHLTFTPRIEQARFLVKHFKPSAMMDISDGLAGDLNHLLKASNVGADINLPAIPRNANVSITQALTDGEDFELLFTLDPKKANQLMDSQLDKKALHFYPIGTITANTKQKIHAKSFTHF